MFPNAFVTPVLELEEKGVCSSITMALIQRFAFFSLLLSPYQCEAAAENCSETQCLLLPDGDDQVASEFRLKASEKGARLVHINLVIGNASYDPLELPDVFLFHRWIWATTIREPMLSLPDDYDILSAGLLNYQLLHKTTPEVCVAMINKAVGNVRYHCCDMYMEDTGPATIRCDQRVDYDDLILERALFSLYLLILFFLTFYLPVLPLLMPDVFNLENEVEKETRLSKPTILETTRCRPIAEGEQDNQKRTGADQRNTEDEASLPTTICGMATTAADASSTITTINTDGEDTDQNTSNCAENSRKRGEETKFIPVDDSSPMNVSTLLRECVQKLPDIPMSFNIKLAVLLLFVFPCELFSNSALSNRKREVP